MSKLIKGAVKGIKKIAKGIGKVFKKIASSTLGKVLIAAAAIYLGGAAFGLWNSPFSAVNGAFVKGAADTAAQQVVAGGVGEAGVAVEGGIGATAAEGAAGAEIAGGVGEAGVVGGSAPSTTGALSSTVPAAETGLAVDVGGQMFTAQELAAGAAKDSMLTKAMTGTGRFLKGAGQLASDNPFPTAMGLKAVSSMLTPDESDLMDQRARRLRSNFAGIGNVDLGFSPSADQVLRDNQGAPVYRGSMIERLRQRSSI